MLAQGAIRIGEEQVRDRMAELENMIAPGVGRDRGNPGNIRSGREAEAAWPAPVLAPTCAPRKKE